MAVYSKIYNYTLDLIENQFNEGDKLPGARRIAELFSCSLPKVQVVLDSLEQSGVVEGRERSGTYVSKGYGCQILPNNISCPRFADSLTESQQKKLQKLFPFLHLSKKFTTGGIEIAPSLDIQIRQQHFLNLNDIFEECYPDYRSRFHLQALEPFKKDGRLYAIPLVFSPHLLWYNPELFKKYNIPLPRQDWTGNDFFAAMRQFKPFIPSKNIINYSPSFHQWMGFLHSSGGRIFGQQGEDAVLADSPETIAISKTYLKLLKEFNLDWDFNAWASPAFAEGKMAMYVGFKDNARNFKKLGINFTPEAIYMPRLGRPVNYQGVMLIAFRKGCLNRENIKKMLQFWLSEEIQETLGRDDCGIPFLRSAAEKSLDPEKTPDSLFLKGLPCLCSDYNLNSEETGSVVLRASKLLNTGTPDDVEPFLRELATTLRFLMKLKNS